MKATHWAPALLVAGILTVTLAACSGASSDFTGSWGSTRSGQANVRIEQDGTFHGTDGCNRVTGKGTVSGSRFSFGHFASTMMACPGVTTWFNKASTAKRSGDDLVVYDDGGSKIGTLAKR
ncbi:META domain-containing protein [Humibacter sp.]|uniref:META domain-containing protein n=1 Tax=Humibacter sp. TaxID=1940291 RepID=UPI003F8147B0